MNSHPPTSDFIDELVNVRMSQRLRWADALKGAGEFALAETVFPDMPECELDEEELAA
jgi:hypothetical protein